MLLEKCQLYFQIQRSTATENLWTFSHFPQLFSFISHEFSILPTPVYISVMDFCDFFIIVARKNSLETCHLAANWRRDLKEVMDLLVDKWTLPAQCPHVFLQIVFK